MPELMLVYGTRPEAIKMAPVLRELRSVSEIGSRVVVTGQHRGMLDQVHGMFGIAPETDLAILRPGQSLDEILTRSVSGLAAVFRDRVPDAVVVQGDTTSSTAAAMCAFYHGIPVFHLEAGLRSGDLRSPFPEEANRQLTSRIAALHLAPTAKSRKNLLREGVPAANVVVTGNTGIDALMQCSSASGSRLRGEHPSIWAATGPVILATMHRRENQGPRMESIARALRGIAQSRPEALLVLPLHKNPAVRGVVLPFLQDLPNVVVTEPLEYGEFVNVLQRCTLVLTDSGGVQEEAPSLGKPVLVMREKTERAEAVEAGTARLVGTDETRIVAEVDRLLGDPAAYAAMATAINPYGDGRAAQRSVAAFRHFFGVGERMPDFSWKPRTVGEPV